MAELHITDQRLKPIAAKVLAGERLSQEDGVALYRSPDLLAVGWLANHVREKRHGNVTYFNVNRHINPTNVCVAHCKLCAFGRDPNAPGAYTFALEEIYQRAEQGVREGATEFHMVGGLHPDLPFEYFLEMIRGLKQRCPTRAPESLHHGGGGLLRAHCETFHQRNAAEDEGCGRGFAARRRRGNFPPARAQTDLRPQSQRADVAEHRAQAHEIGLRSNATMLYGHVETEEERVDHLIKLRELQDETHGFVTFIPLAFHPDNTALAHIPKPTGYARPAQYRGVATAAR